MNANVMKYVKIGVPVASLVLSLASKYFETTELVDKIVAHKGLNDKISEKVAEEVAKVMANK